MMQYHFCMFIHVVFEPTVYLSTVKSGIDVIGSSR